MSQAFYFQKILSASQKQHQTAVWLMLPQTFAAKEQVFLQEDLVHRIGFAVSKHVLDATELPGAILLQWCLGQL